MTEALLDGRIPTAAGARRAWGLPVLTRPGRVYQLGDGTYLVARADGSMQPWPVFRWRSIASDPDAKGRR